MTWVPHDDGTLLRFDPARDVFEARWMPSSALMVRRESSILGPDGKPFVVLEPVRVDRDCPLGQKFTVLNGD